MNILLVNDDGWDAPGIAALENVARQFGQVWSVAPLGKMSGCGHQLTLHQPLSVVALDSRHYKVDGSPADCVRVGLSRLGVAFDWVWSGINEGSNLGCDVYRSGTVAAAREAALLGVKAIALSQYQRRWLEPYPWEETQQVAAQVLEELLSRTLAPPHYWNVNFPDNRPTGTGDTRLILASASTVTTGDAAGDVDSATVGTGDGSALPSTQVVGSPTRKATVSSQPPVPWVDCFVDPSPLVLKYEHEAEHSHYRGIYWERPRIAGSDISHCFGGRVTISRLGPEGSLS